jgi:thiol-disulfide isomerase/thioredoxin
MLCNKFSAILLLVLGMTLSVWAQEKESSITENTPPRNANLPIGSPTTLPQITLKDQHGKSWNLHEEKDAKAVVLYVHGIGCPIVRLSAPTLEEIKKEYAPKGVEFFMLNSNAYDTAEEVLEDANDFSITMPVLMDQTQDTARALKIERTCTVIVAAPAQDWKIVYRGAVNDRYDYLAQKPKAEEEWLRDALDAVLKGEEVKVANTQPKGCLINYIEKK